LFITVESRLVPPSIDVWKDEMSKASSHSLAGSLSKAGQYPLPDPSLILVSTNKDVQASMLRTWLKLCEACLTRLQSGLFEKWSRAQWHDLLMVEIANKNPSSKAAAAGIACLEKLRCLLSSQYVTPPLYLSHLQASPACWYGTALPDKGLPPIHIIHQILWELYKINFHYKVVALDTYYSKSL
jgi:hypothetical protein